MVAETLDAATEHSGDRAGVGGPMDEPTYAERDEIVRAMSLLGLPDGFTAEELDRADRHPPRGVRHRLRRRVADPAEPLFPGALAIRASHCFGPLHRDVAR